MEDSTKTTRLLKAINGVTRRGGLFCQLKDQDLNRCIMSLANEFQRSNPDAFECPKQLLLLTMVGRMVTYGLLMKVAKLTELEIWWTLTTASING